MATPVGQPEALTVTFASGTPAVPFDPAKVQLIVGQLTGTSTTTHVYPNPPGDLLIQRTGTGVYTGTVATPAADIWQYRWEGYDANNALLAVQKGAFLVVGATLDTASYPFPYGYCDVSDVSARVVTWQGKVNDAPTLYQVQQFIVEASAYVDSVLRKRGYVVPLAVAPGFTAIDTAAWAILLNVTAAYAASHLEQARHGSQDKKADENARFWLHYADDIISRLETGEENLTVFGVAGPFEPDPDPARAIFIGALQPSAVSGNTRSALFTQDSLSNL